MFLLLLFTSLVLISLLVYLKGKYNENYWKKRGVIFHKRNKLMGVFYDFLVKDRAFFEHLNDVYKQYPNEPAVGLGSLVAPILYVKDPKNVQFVLSSDFNSFSHRGVEMNEDDLLAQNILFLNGRKWKVMRQSMTPLFTAAKLKSMYYIMDKSAQDFIGYIRESPKMMQGNTFNNLSTFCSAALTAAVFGVTTQSIFDSPFLLIAQKAMKPGLSRHLKFAIGNLSITLFKLLRLKLFKEFEDLFIGAIKQVLRARETENVKKHDFADICVNLQSKGILTDTETNFEVEPTDELLAAQAFFFYVAGVEPTAASMFATLVELGRNPDALQRLHEEIDETLAKCDGKLSYDVVANMSYLDMVISEAVRLYPPIGYLTRMCVKETVLPVGNIKIDEGTKIITPIFDLHHDERYYPNPEAFIPERFSRENKSATADITYMPFGKGNRICIGLRYAQLQAKAGLVHLLHNYTVRTNVFKEGMRYSKDRIQVRLSNVDVELLPRN